MGILTLNPNEAIATGSAIGGIMSTYFIAYITIIVFLIIAWWKVFVKAGEPGWKSLIPIYNIYILCKIIGINFWIYVIAIPFGLIILNTIAASNNMLTLTNITDIATIIYGIALSIYEAIKLGNAFKKGVLFKICIIFFAPICYLILGFGKDKYVGRKNIKK